MPSNIAVVVDVLSIMPSMSPRGLVMRPSPDSSGPMMSRSIDIPNIEPCFSMRPTTV